MGTAQLLQAGGLIAVAGFSIAIVKVLWATVKEQRAEIVAKEKAHRLEVDGIQNARIEELKAAVAVLQDNERIYLSLTEKSQRERGQERA